MGAYHRPVELSEALALLAAGSLTIAAGCTDLFPATQAKSLPGDILDITGVPALQGVSHGPNGWRIGAAATWTDLLRADLSPGFDGLRQAAREIGSVQIQNAGTLAGNLCTASPAGDGMPCLLTLDASVELQSVGEIRVLPLQEFLVGPRQTALRPDECLTAILIPEAAGRGVGRFEKLGARKYLVISIAMVAVWVEIENGWVRRAAIAVGACGPVATRLPELEAALAGLPLAECACTVMRDLVASRLAPIDDIRADRAYRIDAATELVRRSFAELTATGRAAA